MSWIEIVATYLTIFAAFMSVPELQARGEDAPKQAPFAFQKGEFSERPIKECPMMNIQLEVREKSAQLRDRGTGNDIGGTLRPRRIFDNKDRFVIICWAFSPDGEHVAIGAGYVTMDGDPNNIGDIRVWNTRTGSLVASLELKGRERVGAVRALAYSKDGRTIKYVADRFRIDGP